MGREPDQARQWFTNTCADTGVNYTDIGKRARGVSGTAVQGNRKVAVERISEICRDLKEDGKPM